VLNVGLVIFLNYCHLAVKLDIKSQTKLCLLEVSRP